MNLLRNFLRARLAARHAHSNRRDGRRREWNVTVPAPRVLSCDRPWSRRLRSAGLPDGFGSVQSRTGFRALAFHKWW